MKRIGLILIIASTAITALAEDAWWNKAWKFRQRIDINASVLNEDVAGVPLTIRVPNPGAVAQRGGEAGKDLRVVDGSGALWPFEIVQWSKDAIEITTQAPKVVHQARGQRIYLYFGNQKAEALPSAHVWDEHYRAVLHLNGSVADASGKNTKVTTEGAVQVGDGATFTDQQGFFRVDPAALAGIGEQISILIRFKAHPTPGLQTLASGNKGADKEEWFNFGIKTPNTVHTNAASHGERAPELNPQGIASDEWHAAAVVYDARAKTRTICIDGVVLERDHSLPGNLEVKELRIGRGLLHFDPWQFNGVMDEVRIADAARSDAWLRAEVGALGDRAAFLAIGGIQEQGQPAPVPGTFALLHPDTGLESRKRAGVTLEWSPSAGADEYSVVLFDAQDAKAPVTEVPAKDATSLALDAKTFAGQTIFWTVKAHSASGDTIAPERRKLSFYNWNDGPAQPPKYATAPLMSPARDATYELTGYLRKRIDNVIHRYLMETPESSPAILQVFRDRDKTPARDPLVPWAGEFAGKYLTAAELTWRLTHDADLKKTIDQFVRDLIACQAEDGYLGPFSKESRLTGGNWDVWGHYHCMLGLLLYYEDTNYAPALDTCRKAADLLFETFGPGGPTLTNDGAGGQMNMAVCHGLLLLYSKTGETRYLDLAKYIINDAWNEPNAGHYLESALADKRVVEYPQHRWESIHDWEALSEMYWLTGDEQYAKGLRHNWHEALSDVHNTGGITCGEGFVGKPFELGSIETCCTVAWIALSVDVLRATGSSLVADGIELSTFNSALGAIPYSGRVCAYNVPMNGTRVFGVELPWQSPKAGPDLNCCAVNANRALGMISQWALMEREGGLVLNFYGPCAMTASLPGGNKVTLKQITEYPLGNEVNIDVKPERDEDFPLWLRIPNWATHSQVFVNGDAMPNVTSGKYITLRRTWHAGDTIKLLIDFTPYTSIGGDTFKGYVSVYRGPLLLAFDARYSDMDPAHLPAVNPDKLDIQVRPSEGPIEPWLRADLSAADGKIIPVVDLSSAGQTGNQYVTWLPMAAK